MDIKRETNADPNWEVKKKKKLIINRTTKQLSTKSRQLTLHNLLEYVPDIPKEADTNHQFPLKLIWVSLTVAINGAAGITHCVNQQSFCSHDLLTSGIIHAVINGSYSLTQCQ